MTEYATYPDVKKGITQDEAMRTITDIANEQRNPNQSPVFVSGGAFERYEQLQQESNARAAAAARAEAERQEALKKAAELARKQAEEAKQRAAEQAQKQKQTLSAYERQRQQAKDFLIRTNQYDPTLYEKYYPSQEQVYTQYRGAVQKYIKSVGRYDEATFNKAYPDVTQQQTGSVLISSSVGTAIPTTSIYTTKEPRVNNLEINNARPSRRIADYMFNTPISERIINYFSEGFKEAQANADRKAEERTPKDTPKPLEGSKVFKEGLPQTDIRATKAGSVITDILAQEGGYLRNFGNFVSDYLSSEKKYQNKRQSELKNQEMLLKGKEELIKLESLALAANERALNFKIGKGTATQEDIESYNKQIPELQAKSFEYNILADQYNKKLKDESERPSGLSRSLTGAAVGATTFITEPIATALTAPKERLTGEQLYQQTEEAFVSDPYTTSGELIGALAAGALLDLGVRSFTKTKLPTESKVIEQTIATETKLKEPNVLTEKEFIKAAKKDKIVNTLESIYENKPLPKKTSVMDRLKDTFTPREKILTEKEFIKQSKKQDIKSTLERIYSEPTKELSLQEISNKQYERSLRRSKPITPSEERNLFKNLETEQVKINYNTISVKDLQEIAERGFGFKISKKAIDQFETLRKSPVKKPKYARTEALNEKQLERSFNYLEGMQSNELFGEITVKPKVRKAKPIIKPSEEVKISVDASKLSLTELKSLSEELGFKVSDKALRQLEELKKEPKIKKTKYARTEKLTEDKLKRMFEIQAAEDKVKVDIEKGYKAQPSRNRQELIVKQKPKKAIQKTELTFTVTETDLKDIDISSELKLRTRNKKELPKKKAQRNFEVVKEVTRQRKRVRQVQEYEILEIEKQAEKSRLKARFKEDLMAEPRLLFGARTEYKSFNKFKGKQKQPQDISYGQEFELKTGQPQLPRYITEIIIKQKQGQTQKQKQGIFEPIYDNVSPKPRSKKLPLPITISQNKIKSRRMPSGFYEVINYTPDYTSRALGIRQRFTRQNFLKEVLLLEKSGQVGLRKIPIFVDKPLKKKKKRLMLLD